MIIKMTADVPFMAKIINLVSAVALIKLWPSNYRNKNGIIEPMPGPKKPP